MGLDVWVMTKNDYDKIVADDLSIVPEEYELAYGRKTWDLKNFFEMRSKKLDDEGTVCLVPEDAWDDFKEEVSVHEEDIKYYLNKIDEYERGHIEEEDAVDAYRSISNIMDELYNEEGYYQLGPDWEAFATMRWYEAYDKIKEKYASGEQIVMVSSW